MLTMQAFCKWAFQAGAHHLIAPTVERSACLVSDGADALGQGGHQRPELDVLGGVDEELVQGVTQLRASSERRRRRRRRRRWLTEFSSSVHNDASHPFISTSGTAKMHCNSTLSATPPWPVSALRSCGMHGQPACVLRPA
eukprot:1146458-Pelagomonas_calceolata.AAC.8